MRLGERLGAVADFVPPGMVAADIGTDHAYLAVELAERGAARVIAADLNYGPCESARCTVRENGHEDKIEVRQGDGLSVLEAGEAEAVCIAGMGGQLMAAILEARPETVRGLKRLVLQPMNDTAFLRRWLYQNGWRIVDEALAREAGKLYEVICAEPGRGKAPAGVMAEVGERLWEKKPPLLRAHINELIGKKRKILAGMAKSEEAKKSARYGELLKEKAELEEMVKCLNAKR